MVYNFILFQKIKVTSYSLCEDRLCGKQIKITAVHFFVTRQFEEDLTREYIQIQHLKKN
jgi:hypothetical protein